MHDYHRPQTRNTSVSKTRSSVELRAAVTKQQNEVIWVRFSSATSVRICLSDAVVSVVASVSRALQLIISAMAT